ncbi:MAG TPA: FG-GAP repeat protein [Solirubrobacteraceae bacterium]
MPRRVLVVVALACLVLGVVLHEGLGSVSRPAPSGARSRAASSHGGLLGLPVAAQGPVSAALGRGEATYRIAGLVARNPAQRLSARFERSGVAITAGSTRFAISLKAFGRGSALGAIAVSSPVASANRVSYAHGSLSEWWANGPLGLEQGFDIARRPAGAGALTLALAVPRSARLERGALSLPGGLRYTGVHATDAGGRTLPAWLQMRDGRVLLRVDDRGARYPLRVDPFVQQAELTSADAGAEDDLGDSVAVSGDTAVVGSPHQTYPQVQNSNTDSDPGAAYVFVMGAGGWTQAAKLTAPDSAADGLGWSVAISGNTIVVGAPGISSVSQPCDVNPPADPGVAYVYAMPAGGWANMTPTAALTASDACPGDGLGWSVAISGNTVVAGAPWAPTVADENTPGYPPLPGQGAAYEYTMPPSGWASMTQTAELTASDPSGEDVHLGWSVGVSGNTIVVGDPFQHGQAGAAYVFAMGAGGWASMTQAAELTASDPNPGSDQLGTAVAVSGDTIVVGAPVHSTGPSPDQFEAGAADVYTMPPTGWANATQTAELTASDGQGALGSSVAVSGNTVVAGAPSHQVGSNDASGAAYVYTMPAGGWSDMTEPFTLSASDGSTSDNLGHAVAVSGSTVLAGAPRHVASGATREAGAAYVFAPASESSTGGGTTGGGTTTGGGSTTGGSGGSTGSTPPSAKVVSISGASGKLTVTLSCPAGGTACAAVTVDATVKEHLKGKKITAIAAGAKKKKAPTTKQVVVASGSVTLSAGASQALTLTLNSTGRALLSKFGKLTTIVTVSSAGKTIDTATVTVQKATKPKKKK